jgi:hypothetical protein
MAKAGLNPENEDRRLDAITVNEEVTLRETAKAGK